MISLKYKKICITGTLSLMTREDAVSEISRVGGYFDKSVTTATDYLIVADKAGATKLNKAKSLKIPMLTERQFLDILKGEKISLDPPKKAVKVEPPTQSNLLFSSREW